MVRGQPWVPVLNFLPIQHRTPVVYANLAGPAVPMNSPVPTSYLALETLGLHTPPTVPGFTSVLGIQTHTSLCFWANTLPTEPSPQPRVFSVFLAVIANMEHYLASVRTPGLLNMDRKEDILRKHNSC